MKGESSINEVINEIIDILNELEIELKASDEVIENAGT